ncbi:MAG: electron transport complex subunit RsxG [Gammaproteobacteria bacterium]|jgi:electron transport complex protein RnfG
MAQADGGKRAWRQILVSGIVLGAFALAGAALVAVTEVSTRDIIARNEHDALLRSLHEIIPPNRYNNDLAHDTITVEDADYLGTNEPVTVYRARKDGKPVAAIFTSVAPDGYNGSIHLLVGIYTDGTVAGVRVVSEQETPGLGDKVERSKTDWITRFAGHTLGNPPRAQWAVKKDGGVFDQFTGATITPRAVVKAVRNTLIYFHAHHEAVFATPGPSAKTHDPHQ